MVATFSDSSARLRQSRPLLSLSLASTALVAILCLPSTSLVAGKVLDSRQVDPTSRSITLGAASQLQILHPVPEYSEQQGEDGGSSHSAIAQPDDALFAGAQLLVNKPIGDHRSYQHAVLDNGIEVVSVRDEKTKASAFAVAVTAGLYYDPPEHRGLAHLTEHSLFLGSEKYPDRTGFDEYLAMSGGSSNAYTAEEVTVYYGDLDNSAFTEGLDRFSDMFRAPRLNASEVYQEVSAVVSEHSKNVQNPTWYCERVMLSTAHNASPIEHFHTGDELTLKNLGADNVTNDIKNYVKNNYCPPRMKLVTFGATSVRDQLLQANATFGNIPRAGKEGVCSPTKQTFETPAPFTSQNLQKWLLVEGSTWSGSLWMLFPLPDLSPLAKSHPMNYAEYMLGYGGKGSLSLVLRDQLGLADGVSLSADDSSAGTMVWITASLTPRGVENPGAVMDVIFTFLAHAKKGCTDEKIQSLAKSAKLVWDWPNPMEASKAASTIAERMTRLKKEDVLQEDDLMQEPNKTRVEDVLDKLHPHLMNVGLVRPDASQIWKRNPDVEVYTLPHYGVKYSIHSLDDWDTTWHDWGKADDSDDENMTQAYANLEKRLRAQNVSFIGNISVVLPPEIEGIPEHMATTRATAEKGNDTISKLWGVQAHSLEGNDTAEVWYRKGWTLPQPWVEASLTLRAKKESPDTMKDAKDVVMLQVGMHLLADELDERLADTGYKGYYFSVSQTHSGVYVWIGSFTPNVVSQTDRLLMEMNRALDNVDNVSLARIVGGLHSDFTDSSGEAIKSGFADMRVLLTPRRHAQKELADAMESMNITYLDARQAVMDVRHGKFYVSSLIMGNYGEDESKSLNERVLAGLGSKHGVTADEVEKVTPVVMPARPVELRKTNPRESDINHVTIVTMLVGTATVQNRVLLGIVGSMHSQLVFAELRTKMELGYVVSGGVSAQSTILTIDCYVQGSKKMPDEVEADCENVWSNTVPDQVSKLTTDDFNSHKDAFKASLLEGPLSTNQELTHFEDPILLGGCLGLRKAMLDFLETVDSKEDLMKAWSDVFTPGNATHVHERKKVVVKYWSDGMDIPEPPTYKKAKETYKKAGLTGTVLTRMLKEFNSTRYVSEANSTVRDSLVKEGGYYPTDLSCSYNASVASTSSSDDISTVLEKKKPSAKQPPTLHKKNALEISANGKGRQALMRNGNPALMRSEADTLRSVMPHSENEIHGAASKATATGNSAHHASHHRRFVARHPRLQPRPSSHSASLFHGLAGRADRVVRGNLPGLPGKRRASARLAPWEREVLPLQFTDEESSMPWSAPTPHQTRASRFPKRST